MLPEKWIEPFGTDLSTNESWGGVRYLTDGTAPEGPVLLASGPPFDRLRER